MNKKNNDRLTRFKREKKENIEEDLIFEPKKRKSKGNIMNNSEEEIEVLDENNEVAFKKKPAIKLARHKRKRKKLKKWAAIILLLVVILLTFIGTKLYLNKKEEEKKKNEEITINEIKSHYNEYVKTNRETKLMIKENNEFKEKVTIFSDVELELDKVDIDKNTKYFPLKDSDYYIEYQAVDKINEIKNDIRYKSYIPFNLNVITKEKFTLYLDDKKMYTFNDSMNFPIIINNYEDKYYVEYQNHLVSIKKDDIKEIVENNNTEKKNQSKITTLAYHQVYDTDEKCTDPYICIKKASFDQEMKYLKDNNYMTLTMDELYMYLKGNLQVEKAVVLTFDDGFLTKSMIDVMEKYDLLGTLFVITAYFKDFSEFESPNILVQSHTDNMHRNYKCPGGSQGGAILCASEADIKKDLETSIEKLGNKPIALAFPFYDYNDKAIKVLKEVGFKMSFIGRAGVMGRATPNKTDVYKIPRMTVWEQSIMPFSKWKSYL